MKTRNMYALPVDVNDFGRAVTDARVHFGILEHAVDFLLPEGTRVRAAASGEVVEVRDDSCEGGFEERYKGNTFLNWVTVRHDSGEYSQYAHLAYKSGKVAVGQVVKKGDVLALSGNTGYSSAPHLHFHVLTFTKGVPGPEEEWKTLEVCWESAFPIERYGFAHDKTHENL